MAFLGAGAFTALMPHKASAEQAQQGSATAKVDDEAYWSSVRNAFEVDAERMNFVNVVRGVTPKRIRLAVATESEYLNAFRRAPDSHPTRDDVRARVAAFVGAPRESVALVRNTTEGVATVLANWPLSAGDEILTTSTEHGPFYDLLAARAARDGVVPRQFHLPAPTTDTAEIVAALDRAITPRTKLVMIGSVVLTGQIMPVRDIADVVHRRGALLLVDGVLGLGHIPQNVVDMDCDFYAAGFHKWGCGPRATAVFYVKPGHAERLAPLFGAVGDDGRTLTPLWASDQMTKFESFGAHPDAHFTVLGSAIDFLSEIGIDRVQARLRYLTKRWLDRANRLPRFQAAVANDPAHSAGLVAWEFNGIDREKVTTVFRRQRMLVGRTEPYAGVLNIPEGDRRALRITSAALFTSLEAVDAFADALEEVDSLSP